MVTQESVVKEVNSSIREIFVKTGGELETQIMFINTLRDTLKRQKKELCDAKNRLIDYRHKMMEDLDKVVVVNGKTMTTTIQRDADAKKRNQAYYKRNQTELKARSRNNGRLRRLKKQHCDKSEKEILALNDAAEAVYLEKHPPVLGAEPSPCTPIPVEEVKEEKVEKVEIVSSDSDDSDSESETDD